MDISFNQQDHRNNEFYSYRYSSRFQKGDIVEVRLGNDLEAARFQARKNFPDVLNEYWWLKPSDIPVLREIPFQVSDIFFYTGGIPVLVLIAANGSLFRKAQIFMRKKDEQKTELSSEIISKIEQLDPAMLSELLLNPDLNIRRKAIAVLTDKFPDYQSKNIDELIIQHILTDNYNALKDIGEMAIEPLLERFFVTARPKEPENILQTIISIGCISLPRLEDTVEYISEMASPFYAKRIKWTISEIKKANKRVK
jgi:hypothetical protein